MRRQVLSAVGPAALPSRYRRSCARFGMVVEISQRMARRWLFERHLASAQAVFQMIPGSAHPRLAGIDRERVQATQTVRPQPLAKRGKSPFPVDGCDKQATCRQCPQHPPKDLRNGTRTLRQSSVVSWASASRSGIPRRAIAWIMAARSPPRMSSRSSATLLALSAFGVTCGGLLFGRLCRVDELGESASSSERSQAS